MAESRVVGGCGDGPGGAWYGRPPEDAANPLLAEPERSSWPSPPGGERYQAIAAGARLVSDAMTGRTPGWIGHQGLDEPDRRRLSALARDVGLLLPPRGRGRGGAGL